MTLFADGSINIIPPDSWSGFHVFCRENATVLQFAATKIEEQSHWRACGFQVVDDLRQFIEWKVGQVLEGYQSACGAVGS